MKAFNKQTGQVIIILLLIVLVVLTMVITVNRRTVTDVLTSTQNDQASKAFSAAEAGIDYARQAGSLTSATTVPFGNESTVTISPVRLYPNTAPPDSDPAASPLEYPPIGKETIAHFWLANPSTLAAVFAQTSTLTLYFGNNEDLINADGSNNLNGNEEAPAIEVKSVLRNSSGQYFFGPPLFYDSNSSRTSTNGFTSATCPSGGYMFSPAPPLSPNQSNLKYSCHFNIFLSASPIPAGSTPILLRVRLLYSSKKHRIALKPTGSNLPPQAKIFTATGTSGKSTKTLQVFSIIKVPPFFFDFALFSTSAITK